MIEADSSLRAKTRHGLTNSRTDGLKLYFVEYIAQPADIGVPLPAELIYFAPFAYLIFDLPLFLIPIDARTAESVEDAPVAEVCLLIKILAVEQVVFAPCIPFCEQYVILFERLFVAEIFRH